jgi:hypothetical protein
MSLVENLLEISLFAVRYFKLEASASTRMHTDEFEEVQL